MEHCVKSVQIRSFLWSIYPVFGLDTEIFVVNLCIQSEYKKIRTRKNSVLVHFSRSGTFIDLLISVPQS